MENTDIKHTQEEKMKWVLENTCKEVNRVLRNWRASELVITQNDAKSIFRNFFSRFYKHQYDWRSYTRLVRWESPSPVIYFDRLIGIDLAHDCEKSHPFVWAGVATFNYGDPALLPTKMIGSEFTRHMAVKSDDLESIGNTSPDKLINYAKLESIKFT